MCQIGDKVSVLDEDVEGVVCSVDDHLVQLETTDGFVLSYHPKDLIKTAAEISVTNHEAYIAKKSKDLLHKKKSTFSKNRNQTVLEVDLHIEKLISSTKNFDAIDILNLQINTAKKQLNFAQSKQIKTVVLIHGYGEGILKKELEFLLSRYPNLTYSDASYQKYGIGGATEVLFN